MSYYNEIGLGSVVCLKSAPEVPFTVVDEIRDRAGTVRYRIATIHLGLPIKLTVPYQALALYSPPPPQYNEAPE